MKNSQQTDSLDLIQKQIEDSINWLPKNTESVDFQRVEGTLESEPFKSKLLATLELHERTLNQLTTGYACGFEIEFYLPSTKITELKQLIADCLPDYQMLLIDLETEPKTNHRHFYLIKESTGYPPEGMNSYELVSPILDYKSLPYFVTSFFEILQQVGAQDNDSIGFHLHVSTLDNIKLSPISLLYQLDQQNLLDNQERKYTRDIIKQFFNYSAHDWKWIFEEITRKCYNVNFLYYADNNHIELRSMGGAGYLEASQEIITNCFKTFVAYDLAINSSNESIAEAILNNYSLKQNLRKTQKMTYNDLKKTSTDETWVV